LERIADFGFCSDTESQKIAVQSIEIDTKQGCGAGCALQSTVLAVPAHPWRIAGFPAGIAMTPIEGEWNDSQPIYRQLRDRVVAMVLEGVLKEGEAIPSVRQVATEYRLNPLTILKAYQQLVDEGLVEKRRGLGMFVAPGASAALMKDERERFLSGEWPRVQATIARLGLSVETLLAEKK
jgi:GntR family transcriptional regulator